MSNGNQSVDTTLPNLASKTSKHDYGDYSVRSGTSGQLVELWSSGRVCVDRMYSRKNDILLRRISTGGLGIFRSRLDTGEEKNGRRWAMDPEDVLQGKHEKQNIAGRTEGQCITAGSGVSGKEEIKRPPLPLSCMMKTFSCDSTRQANFPQ